jgi:lipopolysaccharide transport system permease protein
MVLGRDLIGKVYFPRILIPVAAVLSGLLDFGISFAVLLVLMIYYGIAPTLNVIFLPILLLFAIITSLGVGLWLATLNVMYRDVAFIAPFLVQVWLFATPIAYPSNLVPARWRIWYGINPMTGVVEGFRWAMLGTGTISLLTFAVSGIISVLLLATGLVYFKHYERTFADMI